MADYILARIFPYGAPEVQAGYQAAMSKGIIAATLLHLLAVLFVASIKSEVQTPALPIPGPIVITPWDFTPEAPPRVDHDSPIRPSNKTKPPEVAHPVMVLEVEDKIDSSEAQASATGSDSANEGLGDFSGAESGESASGFLAQAGSGADERPSYFQPHEIAPRVIRSAKPQYPELAVKAGMEGAVHVRIWVDKEGRVREVEILRSDAEIFNQAAIEAVRQMFFTPAVQGNQPVAVWVSMPIKFRLKAR